MPYNFPPMPVHTVTPFTYSDNATYLQILEQLRAYVHGTLVNEINNALKSQVESIESLLAEYQNTVDKMLEDIAINGKTYTDEEIHKLREDLLAYIREINSEGLAWNPTNGRYESLSIVIGSVYDNLRYFGYFAQQYDNLDLTASEYDALDYNARKYDLSPINDDNFAVPE